eukprot:403374089
MKEQFEHLAHLPKLLLKDAVATGSLQSLIQEQSGSINLGSFMNLCDASEQSGTQNEQNSGFDLVNRVPTVAENLPPGYLSKQYPSQHIEQVTNSQLTYDVEEHS